MVAVVIPVDRRAVSTIGHAPADAAPGAGLVDHGNHQFTGGVGGDKGIAETYHAAPALVRDVEQHIARHKGEVGCGDKVGTGERGQAGVTHIDIHRTGQRVACIHFKLHAVDGIHAIEEFDGIESLAVAVVVVSIEGDIRVGGGALHLGASGIFRAEAEFNAVGGIALTAQGVQRGGIAVAEGQSGEGVACSRSGDGGDSGTGGVIYHINRHSHGFDAHFAHVAPGDGGGIGGDGSQLYGLHAIAALMGVESSYLQVLGGILAADGGNGCLVIGIAVETSDGEGVLEGGIVHHGAGCVGEGDVIAVGAGIGPTKAHGIIADAVHAARSKCGAEAVGHLFNHKVRQVQIAIGVGGTVGADGQVGSILTGQRLGSVGVEFIGVIIGAGEVVERYESRGVFKVGHKTHLYSEGTVAVAVEADVQLRGVVGYIGAGSEAVAGVGRLGREIVVEYILVVATHV